MSDKSLYDILGVRADASQAEIRAAYLTLAKQWHPDRNAGNETEAERRFKEIAHAYDVLSDPEKRAAYDAAGGANQQSTASDGSMEDDAAFDLFISVLLDLAFELAASGADQISIYEALVSMGCPSGTAQTLAQRAHKLGGKGNAASGDRQHKAKSNQNGASANDDLASPSTSSEISGSSDYGVWQWTAALTVMAFGLAVIAAFASSRNSSGPEAEATEAAAEANSDSSMAAVEFNQSDRAINQAEITFETVPLGGVIVINGQEYVSGSKLLYDLSAENIRDGFVKIMGGFAYWGDGHQSRYYKSINAYFDGDRKGKYVFLQDFQRNSEFINFDNYSNEIASENIAKKPSLGTEKSFVEPDIEVMRKESEPINSDIPYDFSGIWTGVGQDEGMSWDIRINIMGGNALNQLVGESYYTNNDIYTSSCKSRLRLLYVEKSRVIVEEDKINAVSVGCIGSPAGKRIVIQRSINGSWHGVWFKKNGSQKVTMSAALNHLK